VAVDFRCENCGKLLSVEADPGGAIRCPHCRKRVQVPSALASLPRPRVPQDAQETSPSAGGDLAGHDATLAVMASLMPWVLSIFFHIGLGLIMMFVVMIFHHRQAPDVVVPGTVLVESSDVLDVGRSPKSPARDVNRPENERTYSRRKSAIESDAGRTRKRVRLIGSGSSSGSSPFGKLAVGGGAAGAKFFGTGRVADHVVYVIDRSGSMATYFDEVLLQLQLSISRLKPTQDFHVIFFAPDRPIENPPGKLVSATREAKLDVVDFLQRNDLVPLGRTTALPALKRAFDVLDGADPRRPAKLVFLLTTGDFAGEGSYEGGGSSYRNKEGQTKVGDEAVIDWLRDHNIEQRVHVNTYLYGTEPRATDVLSLVARENSGTFKLISPDE
jgi:DNA-directed RNA polymerase subunit RPC12/RpoP